MCIIGDVRETKTEAVKPTANSDTFLAIGGGVGVGLLVVVTATMVLTAWCLVKKNRSKSGTYNIYMDYKRGDGGSVVPSSSCGDELKILV